MLRSPRTAQPVSGRLEARTTLQRPHLPGLCETWYTCRSVTRSKVFNLTREEMSANQEKSFKVVAV